MPNLNIKRAPATPGVYFFRDKRGRILYIGKAVNLKKRLASYFKSQLGGRTAKLMEETAKVDWQTTDSEIEALILESHLIKKYHPPFNIMLRDDKQYFYIGFTNEEFSKIFLTHQIQNSLETRNQKLETSFVGPFTDGAALKTTLRFLRRIFPYCTCRQKHNNHCLNYHIGKCLGFCCLKNPEVRIGNYELRRREYKKNVNAIKEILTGKRTALIKKLGKEMNVLAKAEKFERAVELRDKIEKLKKIFQNARIIHNSYLINHNSKSDMDNKTALEELARILKLPSVPKRIEGYDISNIQGMFATGAMIVFTDGQPDKNQYRRFKIRNSNHASYFHSDGDIAMLKEMLVRRFNHPEWMYPDLIIVDGGKAQLNIATKIISSYRKTKGLAITIIALTKNEKHRGDHIYINNKKTAMPLKKLPSVVRNLILQINTEAHRFAISYYRKLHRKIF